MLQPSPSGKKTMIYNALFVAVSAGILLFLLNAPPETTAKLPADGIHGQFYSMDKKEAEKHCLKCHANDKEAPLSKDHPPKNRCLFCHKKVENPALPGNAPGSRN